MKKILLLFLFSVTAMLSAMSQQRNNDREEKLQALKIAFLTQKLELSAADAEKFWPVYNQYDREIQNLRDNRKGKDVLENEQQLLDIRKKYKPRFEKILGTNRYNSLYNAEREFRTVLIKRLKNPRSKRSG